MVFDRNQLKVGVRSFPFSRFPALPVVVKAVLVLVSDFFFTDVKGCEKRTIVFVINQLVVTILPSHI